MHRAVLLILICRCLILASATTDEFDENQRNSRKLNSKSSRFHELLYEVERGQASDDFDDLATLSETEVQNILNGESEDERSKAGKFLLGAGLNLLKDKLHQWGYINKPVDDEDRHSSGHSSRPTTLGDIFCEPFAKSLERRLHVCEADVERGAVALMKSATRLERILRKLRECEKSKYCDVDHVRRIIRQAASTVAHCLFL